MSLIERGNREPVIGNRKATALVPATGYRLPAFGGVA
jgi:hypothetical protein